MVGGASCFLYVSCILSSDIASARTAQMGQGSESTLVCYHTRKPSPSIRNSTPATPSLFTLRKTWLTFSGKLNRRVRGNLCIFNQWSSLVLVLRRSLLLCALGSNNNQLLFLLTRRAHQHRHRCILEPSLATSPQSVCSSTSLIFFSALITIYYSLSAKPSWCRCTIQSRLPSVPLHWAR
jgi:hypothetical protein